MSQVVYQPLDSYRLAQYAEQIPCFICGQGNMFDAEYCRHCQAPMALSHQSASQNIQPRMVAVVGMAAAGKTVFLGMLTDILSRFGTDLQLQARGAFSISVQQSTLGALSRCRFPDKTPSSPDRWNWVHCRVLAAQQKQPLELVMPDLAGEALLQEVEHPHSVPVIRQFLSKCQGVMALIDCERLIEGKQEQDFFAMKLVTYLTELDPNSKTSWRNRPIAWVFTKGDRCDECFDDPREFARKHTPGLWKVCEERIDQTNCFATSAVGSCLRGNDGERIPLRVEPRGIVEPFRWIVERMAQKPKGFFGRSR